MQREIRDQQKLLPYANVTLKHDVSPAVRNYVLGAPEPVPGRERSQRVFLRSYPHKELAAQLFGTVGEISPDELKESRFRGVKQGTIVGKGGLEYTYDRYLRGQGGAPRASRSTRSGGPRASFPEQPPRPGQAAQAVARPRPPARRPAGDVRGGRDPDHRRREEPRRRVRGAWTRATARSSPWAPTRASTPTSSPSRCKQSTFNKLNSEENGAPLVNRAINGLLSDRLDVQADHLGGGAASPGTITPDTVIDDPGSIQIGNIVFQNAGKTAHGAIALRDALTGLLRRLLLPPGRPDERDRRQHPPEVGAPPGPGPAHRHRPARRVARASSRARAWRDRAVPQEARRDRPWSVGDNVNLAVGQGDLQATPLQMATAYSTVANGGKVPTPAPRPAHRGRGRAAAAEGRAARRRAA